MLRATAEYRQESDVLGEFFALRLTFKAEGRIARKNLRSAYEEWCRENGHEPVGARRLGARLREHGVTPGNIREGMNTLDGWRGVELSTAEERAARVWGVSSATERVTPDAVVEAPPVEAPPVEETFSDWLEREGVA